MNRMHPFKPQDLTVTEVVAFEIDLMELLTRRRFIVGAGGLLGAAALGACGVGDEVVAPTTTTGVGYPRTIEHTDSEIRLENAPSRVVAADGLRILDYLLSIGVTPVASATGLGDTFATALSDRTEQVEKIGQSGQLNIERIVNLRPDFIVGFDYNFGEGLDELKQIAPCFVLAAEVSDKWDENTRLVARCFVREDEAEAAIAAVHARVAAIGERIGAPVTISVIYPKADGSFYAMQPDFSVAQLRAPAGIIVTLPDGVTTEEGSLADLSPEMLGHMPGEFLCVLPLPDAENVIENNPLWETLDAVVAGRVIRGDVSTWGNFGPIGLQALLDDLEGVFLS